MRREIQITDAGILWVRGDVQGYVEGIPKELATHIKAIHDYIDDQRTDEEKALDVAREFVEQLPDEDKLELVAVFPKWGPETEYETGAELAFEDKLYRCIQGHVSQVDWEPPRTPALWRDVAKGDEVQEWVRPTGAHDAYQLGELVVYKGETWESVIPDNVWSPDEYPAGWKK